MLVLTRTLKLWRNVCLSSGSPKACIVHMTSQLHRHACRLGSNMHAGAGFKSAYGSSLATGVISVCISLQWDMLGKHVMVHTHACRRAPLTGSTGSGSSTGHCARDRGARKNDSDERPTLCGHETGLCSAWQSPKRKTPDEVLARRHLRVLRHA